MIACRNGPRKAVVRVGAALAAWALSGCTPGGVGDPCTPEEEYEATFGGFGIDEVNVESRSFQCESRTCLVNHFQGRVSCPYGQNNTALSLDGTDPARCRLPGTSGVEVGDAVTVPVQAWNAARPPEDSVYCSCRCAGPDPSARYCDCPSGFVCTELVGDYQVGRNQLVGSYCIREGTEYQRATASTQTCATAPSDRCPEPRGVNP